MIRFRPASIGLILTVLSLAAAPIPHAQDRPPNDPYSPAEAARRMTVPEGFAVEVVASEPDIVNPVAMTIDERGRFWITESLEYPRKSAGPGRDRVKVLEDTDGDGKADKFTVFAEGLNIPSGIAVGHGGVWVANSPDILFLTDTDGDGKADTREVVVSGFGRDDTHELPNSLTWGPDGWLYGWNGVFNRSHVVYRGKTYDFTCAIFRIHPRTRDFELFCEGTSNPWGLTWNRDGEAFASACVIDHLWHLSETGYYHRQGGPYPPFTWKAESIVGHKHQKAAYCGIEFFDSAAYPEEYRERLYMGNIHGNAVNVDTLSRHGSTYRGETRPDFLQAHDAWFMPVVQRTGPDGSLYILDWYDRYHCYQDANRDPEGIDRLKGRLYRVRYKDTPRRSGFDLARESDDRLIALLGSANIYDRATAQRLLAERNTPAVRQGLDSVLLAPGSAPKQRRHALWARLGCGPLDDAAALALLEDDDSTFRAWGVRAAGNARTVSGPVRKQVEGLARDPSPDVRLQVAIAARKVEGIEPMPLLLDVLSASGDDPLIPRIVWQNLHPLLEDQAGVFVRLVAVPKTPSPGLDALLPRAVERILARRDPDPAPIVALLTRFATGPDARREVAGRILDALGRRVQDGEIAGPHLDRLRDGLRPIVQRILTGAEIDTVPFDAALLAASWRDAEALQVVRAVLRSPKADPDSRARALNALIAGGDPGALDDAARALDARAAGKADFRGKVLAALGRLDDPKVAAVVLDAYPRLEPELQPKAVALLTQRPAWSRSLLDAIGAGAIPASALNLNQVRTLLASKDPALVALVKARWGTVREGRNPAREQVVTEMRDFLKRTPGDPAAGKIVFERVCAQCHKIFGEGQDVGPDITANGRGSFDQLLSNVFDPSLVIGASYQATTVATRDGRVLTGLLAEDSPQRIVLKTQGGKLETIARGDVEETKLSPLSLMPEDLEKQLKPRELADLFSFLTRDLHGTK